MPLPLIMPETGIPISQTALVLGYIRRVMTPALENLPDKSFIERAVSKAEKLLEEADLENYDWGNAEFTAQTKGPHKNYGYGFTRKGTWIRFRRVDDAWNLVNAGKIDTSPGERASVVLYLTAEQKAKTHDDWIAEQKAYL